MPFLEVRNTPISLLLTPPITIAAHEARSATQEIRQLVLTDRALHDKAQKAFVSWVQAYSKHNASSIFRVADVDWTDMGEGWGLLKLPKMPELKKWEGDKSLGVKMEWEAYKYKDKMREAQRKIDMKEREAARALGVASSFSSSRPKKHTEAWSQKKENRNARDERREKKMKLREKEALSKMTPAERLDRLKLDEMIEQVRAQNAELKANGNADEWAGFGD